MTDKEWQKLLRKVAEDIYEGKRKGTIDDKMVRETARKLMQGVEEGYGASLNDEDVAPAKYSTLAKMEKNVFHFSGAKNWNQLNEMSALLLDEKGSLKPFSQFLRDVQKVDETYNRVYLNAEYNHAVASSQMIAKWESIVEDSETLPYLMYDAVMDERTRDDHAQLNGIVRKWDDSFWDTYFPPNNWGCRCDVKQLDEDATPTSVPNVVPPKPLFRTNAGKTGTLFQLEHPYFTSLPQGVYDRVIEQSGKLLPHRIKPERLRIFSMPREQQFDEVYPNVFLHKLTSKKDNDYDRVLSEAKHQSLKAKRVEILPRLNTEENVIHHIVFPNYKHGFKCPDLRIDDTYADHKLATGSGSSTLSNNVEIGAEQAEIVIIDYKQVRTLKEVYDAVIGKFKKYDNLIRVEVIMNQQRKVFNKKSPNNRA